MRIVLDTNAVLSALLWRGTRHRLLGAIAQLTQARKRFVTEMLQTVLAQAASR